jgi:hypothetical protein
MGGIDSPKYASDVIAKRQTPVKSHLGKNPKLKLKS